MKSSTEISPDSLNLTSVLLGKIPDYGGNETLNNKDLDQEAHNISGQYYDMDYVVVCVLVNTLIFISGMVGNIMVITVVIRSKNLHTPTNCYLLSLAIADCLVLLAATLPAIPEPFFQITEWPWGRTMCSVLVFLQYFGPNASSLSITAFTVERYIAICHPMRARTMCTVKRAKRIIVGLWIFTALYCSPWIGLTTTITKVSYGKETQLCTFRMKRSTYLAYYVIDLLALYVMPLLIAAYMYGSMARVLLKTVPRGPDSMETGTVCHLRRSISGGGTGSTRQIKHKITNSKMQVVRMLVVIVLVFALGWLPYRTLVVYNSLASERFLNHWFLLFCRVMIYSNSAVNPILYNAMSVKFRRAFTTCLCCGSETTEYDIGRSTRLLMSDRVAQN